MSDEAKQVQVAAELIVSTNTKKIMVNSLSMTSCMAKLTFKVNPRQQVILRLYEKKEGGGFSPFNTIKTTVESFRPCKTDPQVYFAKIKFNEAVKEDQGIIKILNPEKYSNAEKNKFTVTPTKNSLRIASVRCHMCAQENIPFWVLQNRTVLTKPNIFGVPSYVKAMPSRDFCDYNLIRIVVCPKCYFASSEQKDFQKPTHEESFPKPSFNKGAIYKQWNDNISERKKLIETQLDGFFGEERTVEQALLSYDLGVITNDEIFKADEDKDPKRRNYDPPRKSVSCLMFKAELLMANNRVKEAQKHVKKAAIRLEEIFPFLNNEPSIRAGLLLGMIGLYLNDTKKVRQNLSMLRDFNRDGKVKSGSNEYKTLMISTNKLNEAYEDQEDYSKDTLKNFHTPR